MHDHTAAGRLGEFCLLHRRQLVVHERAVEERPAPTQDLINTIYLFKP